MSIDHLVASLVKCRRYLFTLQMMLIKIFAEPKEGKENQGIKLN